MKVAAARSRLVSARGLRYSRPSVSRLAPRAPRRSFGTSAPAAAMVMPLALALPLALAGCGSEETPGAGGGGGGPATADQAVTIRFDARALDRPLDCSARYDQLGTEPVDVGLRDFRFYLHAVRLVGRDGVEVPVALDQDGVWQQGDVVLLDFEDGAGTCVNGNPGLHEAVTGTVPAGDYVGLRFKLGVPFEVNHTDVTASVPPLDVTSLFWGWGEGRIFLSAVTSRTTEEGKLDLFAFQLASTGCEGDPRRGEVVACSSPNRVEVDFPAFDLASQVVVADLGVLLAETPIVTAASCMGTSSEPSCQPLFERIGLDAESGAETPDTQVFFRASAP